MFRLKVGCVIGLLLLLPPVLSVNAQQTVIRSDWPDVEQCRLGVETLDPVAEGWCIAIDSRRGNCVACHTFNISPWPPTLPVAGNLAPPMVAMLARFPDRTELKSIIEDATERNPNASMPPYLKHGILNAEEIDKLIALLESL